MPTASIPGQLSKTSRKSPFREMTGRRVLSYKFILFQQIIKPLIPRLAGREKCRH
jgi:hypothetical protein